jgi:RNA polymerase sigma factor (sigma-70 family)
VLDAPYPDRSRRRPRPLALLIDRLAVGPPLPPRPPIAPLLAADDPLTPETDRRLTALACAARAGSRPARDALYLALAPKIDRFVAGCRHLAWTSLGPRRDGRPWDADDLAQEAFVVFADLLAAWSGEGTFVPYFLAHFPWRLRTAWRALAGPRRHESNLAAPHLALLADDSAEAEEARIRLEAIAAALSPLDGAILLGHVRDGRSLRTVARRLGLGHATVTRRWQGLREELRRELANEM